jgi:hypothetical protein
MKMVYTYSTLTLTQEERLQRECKREGLFCINHTQIHK